MKSSKRVGSIILLLNFFLLNHAISHEKHPSAKTKVSPSEEKEMTVKLHQINETYKKDIKTIFQKSCFDCHSQQARYPWYYEIPGAKKLIDDDIAEAKKHINLTNDFPFQGHGSPKKDLEAISKTIDENSMPPFRYKVLHPGSGLDEDERQLILRWINESLTKLSK